MNMMQPKPFQVKKAPKGSLTKAVLGLFAIRAAYVARRHGYSAKDLADSVVATTKLRPGQFGAALRGRVDVCAACKEIATRDMFFCGHCGTYLGGPAAFDEANRRVR